MKKKQEEEYKKLVISSRINNFEVISKKNNQDNNNKTQNKKEQIQLINISNYIFINLIYYKYNYITNVFIVFISSQNEINYLMEPQKKLILSKNNQCFSLISPDNIIFKKGESLNKSQKLDNHITIQLDNVLAFIKNKEKEQERKMKFQL